jgi:hypothetical protein
MRSAALLLALVAAQNADQRGRELAARVRFAAAETKSDEARRVVALLSDPSRWAAGFREVEEKLGAFADDSALDVTWDYAGDEFAKMAGKTVIRFNLGRLEAYRRKLDELEKQRQELAKQGKRMVYRLPPAKIERFIPHELVHVLQKQRGCEAPEWFDEGLAQWLGDDPNVLVGFALSGRKPDGIEAPLADPNDVYARGHLFFKWLDSKGVLRKAVRAAFFEGVAWKRALEDATGLAWEKLVAAEKDWSARELEKLRPAPK